MKVLVADDEQIIREGIRNHIDWIGLGLELVGTASDGVEAIELFEQFHPVIVITDIKMPELDGLELIRTVHQQNPSVVIVILSAYAEFRIAQEAMRFGVRHYLLKPIDPSEMARVLIAARQDYVNNIARAPAAAGDLPLGRPLVNVQGITNPTIRRVVDFVTESHTDPELSLGSVAAGIAHVHPDYLSRAFKKSVGVSFSRFLVGLRVSHAMELIRRQPELTNQQLGNYAGFGDKTSYFGEAFRKTTGMTVRQFRKTVLEEDTNNGPSEQE